MKKEIIGWIGFVDGKPDFYKYDEYYNGVRHGDFFKTKKEAKECYQDVRKVIIKEI
jgi:hypothetical protein